MITISDYVRVQSLEEAWQLNQKKRNRVIGGMLWMKMGKGSIGTAIDLCDLGLDAIEETGDAFSIGAMATLRQLETHEALNAFTGNAVRKALCDIVGVQFRNLATVGGSLWGRFGFSDVLTMFLALDSYVELYRGGIVPLEVFARQPHDRDILVRLIVKKTPVVCAYSALRVQRTDFPVINCAVSCLGGEYRAVIGARPAGGMVVRDTQKLLAEGLSPERIRAFAAFVAESVPTGSNLRGSAAYRTRLIRTFAERSLMELGGIQ